MLRLTLVALCLASAAAGANEMTKDNFEDLTSGKNAFIKFLAPWCGHCKAMKPAWDKLGETYKDSTSVLIGDADCTASGQSLCQDSGVSGYPTIKYILDGETQDYRGGRDFDSLKKFVEDTLEVKCNVEDPSECTDKEKKYIEKMKGKTAEEVQKQVTRLTKMKGNSMKKELKQWLMQRLAIVTALSKQ